MKGENIVLFSRKIPKGTVETIPMKYIRIPPVFAGSYPSYDKIIKYKKLYQKKGYIDKPLTVVPETNEKGHPNRFVLVDGYIRYLLLEQFSEEFAPVKYQFEYIV
jgi:hypothetical protein